MAEIKLSDLPWGALNWIQDQAGALSGDRRRTSPTTAIRLAIESLYSKDTGVTGTTGVIVGFQEVSYASYQDKTSLLEQYVYRKNDVNSVQSSNRVVYKVYIGEKECRPIPTLGRNDPVLFTYPDIPSVIPGETLEIGTIVAIEYDDPENLFNPRIVRKIGGPIQIESSTPAELSKTFKKGKPSVIPQTIPSWVTSLGNQGYDQYPLGQKRTALFLSVVDRVKATLISISPSVYGDITSDVIRSIVEQPEINNILDKESRGGWIGIPNYRYGDVNLNIGSPSNRSYWPAAAAKAKEGKGGHHLLESEKGNPVLEEYARQGSTAIGLGQLTYGNVKKYSDLTTYYSTNKKIKAEAEARGFVAYIIDRYGDAETAWSVYNKLGTYYHRFKKINKNKTSGPGY